MTISAQMQEKIEKIEKLVHDGYTLKKTEYGFIDFRNSSEKPVNIFGGLKSPAGFSWIAFFFPFAVCTQIKEWSYFYINGCLLAIIAIVNGIASYDANMAGGIAIGITYGYMFPYLRKIAKDNGASEYPKGKSILVGILLSILSAIPSLIIDAFFGNF